LDAESVAWLEKQLKNYSGCIICVTHDRYFLDHVAEWILELDRGEGIPYKGNYAAWLEQKEARLSVSEKTLSAKRKYLQHELEWVRLSSKGRTVKQKARLQAYERLLAETQTKNQGPSPGEIFIPAGPRLQGTVIEAADLTKSYGERVLFKDLSFSLPPGGIVGVIGKNGAGKSTLFRILTDRESPDTGSLKIGEHVVLGYVDQHRTDLDSDKTVFEEVCEGLDYLDLGSHRMASRAYLALFAFRGTEQNKKVKGLSGGERNRLFLAKMLRSGANVLLLDEPTNDLDVDTLRSLEEALQQFAGCAVIISHDRWFLDRVATHILAFEGNGETFFYSGNYQEYEQDKLKRKSIASSSK
jgi:ATPase subunit of ABC transporter with duplicated ATPase domains